jgi:hypothetical protein
MELFVKKSPESLESLRRRYQPRYIRALFIGEAPPVSGRFFYRGDSGLYRAMRDASRSLHSSPDKEDFLTWFQSSGCYLVDLCSHPVDHLDAKSRQEAHRSREAWLARRIRVWQPRVIVTLLLSIRESVHRAAHAAKWRGQCVDAPYPGRWLRHRLAFESSVIPVLEKFTANISTRSREQPKVKN